MSTLDTERWLKLSSVCDKYDVSYTQIFNAVKSGVFGEDAFQSGRLWRVRESAVMAWLRSIPAASDS